MKMKVSIVINVKAITDGLKLALAYLITEESLLAHSNIITFRQSLATLELFRVAFFIILLFLCIV
jgi:hypothetical protein